MEDWGAVRDRLRDYANGVAGPLDGLQVRADSPPCCCAICISIRADIRAALEENATLRAGLEATANHRAKVERELDDVRAEVARLEGLILDAYEFARIKPGNPDDVWLALLCEVGRIRAQREEDVDPYNAGIGGPMDRAQREEGK